MKIKEFKNIKIANSLVDRTIGLMGKKSFGDNRGLLIKDTNSIHTFFVFLPIDVVFLDQDMKVIRLVSNLKPFSFSPIAWKAKHVLELPVGSIEKETLKIGDKIDLL